MIDLGFHRDLGDRGRARQSKERMRRGRWRRNNRRTEELCERECKSETTIEAQSEQSATTRWAMSSGRRSDDHILALASTSLGRRQTTPASFCSADNSSSPSGSLTSQNQPQAAVNDVAKLPEQRPGPARPRRSSSRPQWSHDSIDHRPPFQYKLLFLCAISPQCQSTLIQSKSTK